MLRVPIESCSTRLKIGKYENLKIYIQNFRSGLNLKQKIKNESMQVNQILALQELLGTEEEIED